MTFKEFRDFGKHGVVAVFTDPCAFDCRETVLNMLSLETRIRNMKEQSPGYDPSPDSAVLAELRKRNAPEVAP